jgi:hypothetical protein
LVIWIKLDATLHNIQRADNGLVELTVALGSQPPRVFLAAYDASESGYVYCNFDQELFMALSTMAFRRFGNCAVCQLELTKLIGAFCAGKALPPMPVALGTTPHCTLKPGPLRVLWNKCWILLRRVGLYRPLSIPIYPSRPIPFKRFLHVLCGPERKRHEVSACGHP